MSIVDCGLGFKKALTAISIAALPGAPSAETPGTMKSDAQLVKFADPVIDEKAMTVRLSMRVQLEHCNAVFKIRENKTNSVEKYNSQENRYYPSPYKANLDRFNYFKTDVSFDVVVDSKNPEPPCTKDLEMTWSPYEKGIWKPKTDASFSTTSKDSTKDTNDFVTRNRLRFSNDAYLRIGFNGKMPQTHQVAVGIDDMAKPKPYLLQLGTTKFNSLIHQFK